LGCPSSLSPAWAWVWGSLKVSLNPRPNSEVWGWAWVWGRGCTRTARVRSRSLEGSLDPQLRRPLSGPNHSLMEGRRVCRRRTIRRATATTTSNNTNININTSSSIGLVRVIGVTVRRTLDRRMVMPRVRRGFSLPRSRLDLAHADSTRAGGHPSTPCPRSPRSAEALVHPTPAPPPEPSRRPNPGCPFYQPWTFPLPGTHSTNPLRPRLRLMEAGAQAEARPGRAR
jgi:hypothetical protein